MGAQEEWISLREFAKRCKVNPNAITKALASGRISRRESDKKINWVTQSKAWNGFRDPSKVRDHDLLRHISEGAYDPAEEDEENSESFRAAKTRKEVATAGLKELELQEALGEVVRSAHVRSAMAQFAIDVRESIMTIPDRVASELAAEVAKLTGNALDLETAREIIHKLWRRESRVALEKIGRAEESGERG